MDRLAIVVPYRDRAEHLARFLPHMLAYFQRSEANRGIALSIHIVEQSGREPFNRGMICNCGYLLARDAADYVCFHDVDFLPVAADYARSGKPARLVLPERIIMEGVGLREDAESFFGAVVLFDKPTFERVNGFPNSYWGWGPEDRELGLRCRLAGFDFERRDGAFHTLPHKHAGFSAPGVHTEEARRTNALFAERSRRMAELMAQDGLSSLAFQTLRRSSIRLNGTDLPNAFYYLVDIGPAPSRQT